MTDRNAAEKPYQAKAPATQPFGAEAFEPIDGTVIGWLGMASFLINSRGTTFMLDPLTHGFDMPIMSEPPIAAADVPHLDAVLITHSDNDHYSRPTCEALGGATDVYHSTHWVAELLTRQDLPAEGHDIGASFQLGEVRVTLTPADHAWQNHYPGKDEHWHEPGDACGFWIETPDGVIWTPGDSRLIPDHHLTRPTPDAILFDFSDSEWHLTLDGALQVAAAYPDTPLLLHHWGCVDAPTFSPFNGDPDVLKSRVVNPGRVVVLAPGAPWQLTRLAGN